MNKAEQQHYGDMDHDYKTFVTAPKKERCSDFLLDKGAGLDNVHGSSNKKEEE